jgi:hypothetical protein
MTIAEEVVGDQRDADEAHRWACRALYMGDIEAAKMWQRVAARHAQWAMEGLTELLYRRY